MKIKKQKKSPEEELKEYLEGLTKDLEVATAFLQMWSEALKKEKKNHVDK